MRSDIISALVSLVTGPCTHATVSTKPEFDSLLSGLKERGVSFAAGWNQATGLVLADSGIPAEYGSFPAIKSAAIDIMQTMCGGKEIFLGGTWRKRFVSSTGC